MSGYPDNWDDMGAIARHEWSIAQAKIKAKPAVRTSAPLVPTIAPLVPSCHPDDWDSMGVIARHEWSIAQAKIKEKPAVPTSAPLVPTNALQDEYFYYSTMVKSDEQSLKSIIDHAERDKSKPSLLNK